MSIVVRSHCYIYNKCEQAQAMIKYYNGELIFTVMFNYVDNIKLFRYSKLDILYFVSEYVCIYTTAFS